MSGASERESITAILNIGDNLWHHGLYVPADIHSTLMFLAGLSRPDIVYLLKDDTYTFRDTLRSFGVDWLLDGGDRVIGHYYYMTILANRGLSLSEITRLMSSHLKLDQVTLLPASDDMVQTQIHLESGTVSLLEYLVHFSAPAQKNRTVVDLQYQGAENARPAPGVLSAIIDADLIILGPSNPVNSILPILSIGEISDALKKASGTRIAVSPFVAGRELVDSSALSPNDVLLQHMGIEKDIHSLAQLYREYADILVVDECECEEIPSAITDREHCIRLKKAGTVMADAAAETSLARFLIGLAELGG
jgi:LPPG:FO 2-phospho-L-lactate transferase